MDQSNLQFIGVLGLGIGRMFPLKLSLPLRDRYSHVTHCSWAKPFHHHKRHLDRFSHFCFAVQCFVYGEENPPKLALPLGFQHPAGRGPSDGHRQHAQKIGKDRACGSGDILTDRQTDRHTDVLITILSNFSRGRSNNNNSNMLCTI